MVAKSGIYLCREIVPAPVIPRHAKLAGSATPGRTIAVRSVVRATIELRSLIPARVRRPMFPGPLLRMDYAGGTLRSENSRRQRHFWLPSFNSYASRRCANVDHIARAGQFGAKRAAYRRGR